MTAIAQSNFHLATQSTPVVHATLRFPALTSVSSGLPLSTTLPYNIQQMQFPALLYFGTLSAGGQASSTSSVSQLQTAQVVTVDVTKLYQVWS